MWQRIKRLAGIDKGAVPSDVVQAAPEPKPESEIQMIAADANPWQVPLIDVRPLTFHVTSTSRDPACATNAASFGGDDGTSFIGLLPEDDQVMSASLTYAVDQPLADGVLFVPRQMEHKWAIFYHQQKIIVVRSWRRQVALVADVESSRNQMTITRIQGALGGDAGDESFTERSLDFLIRSHVMALPYPAPLPASHVNDHDAAALWCFSMYGNQVAFATAETIERVQPEQPMRSHSLLHIAVARDDLVAAKAHLAAGISAQALAGDGLAPLHWALATANIPTMELLLAHGSPVDVRSAQGATPLMNAVQSNQLAAVKFLLQRGAQADARDLRGFTALHRAAEMGLHDIAQLLLEAGASPDIDAEGHTPRSFGQQGGDPRMMQLLG